MAGLPPTRYDDNRFVYRGRIISVAVGRAPDELWSCPVCGALVLETDRDLHRDWHMDALGERTRLDG